MFNSSAFPEGCAPHAGVGAGSRQLGSPAACPLQLGPCSGTTIGWDQDSATGQLFSEFVVPSGGMLGLVIGPAGTPTAGQVMVELGTGAPSFSGQSFALGNGLISTHKGTDCLNNGTIVDPTIRLVPCTAAQAKGWLAFRL